ncbi:MAG: lipoate--protein ligase family protein [Candidatus Aadella gelida]|nr:lipoate--protein ligase family protein [Candidatus Aadella gelida]
MKLIDHSLTTPEENIAFDEVLLKEAERGSIGGTMRFWESSEYFVVLGRAGKLNEECLLRNCLSDEIKILRRLSGGGTVLQGPGCINYSLILPYSQDSRYSGIKSSYEAILGKIIEGFDSRGVKLKYMPISDIAFLDKKVSGNAQARKKKHFLHHGTFLSHFKIDKIFEYIKHPKKQPAYRNNRLHEKFVTNLKMSSGDVTETIRDTFLKDSSEALKLPAKLLEDVQSLALEKYSSDKWNKRF